ncbi:MAG TPA: ATP-binding cassette domain-containing protein [Bacteroidales bacterium]|jgi:putative ABC transport system ATP-binding protein|nr:ATP-binding cassette domain-containing protein [Bacteroidales bacterium]HXK73837.1 ATP-binding cassette domain-containing protein [Bacteroidales bacterium]
MEIRFSKIIPIPIPESNIANSEVWNRDLIFKQKNNYLIYADSGKGKTTFVNIILGLRKDYTGNVYIDEKNISNFSINQFSKLRKNHLSIVPQGLQLFSELTVLENINIKNRIQNFKTPKQISEMIYKLGLNGFENKKTAKISFGQKQRVAIIRALCQRFDYILLDEPFSHLDTKNSEIAWDLIKTETEEQNASIIITSLKNDFETNIIKLRM